MLILQPRIHIHTPSSYTLAPHSRLRNHFLYMQVITTKAKGYYVECILTTRSIIRLKFITWKLFDKCFFFIVCNFDMILICAGVDSYRIILFSVFVWFFFLLKNMKVSDGFYLLHYKGIFWVYSMYVSKNGVGGCSILFEIRYSWG